MCWRNLKVALAILLLGIGPIFQGPWRYIFTYREIKVNHTQTAEARCLSVEEDSIIEPYGRGATSIPLYRLRFDNGITVAIYQDVADRVFTSEEAFRKKMVTGNPVSFTYLPHAIFSNEVYVLLSVEENGQPLLDAAVVTQKYASHARTSGTMCIITLCIAGCVFVAPFVVSFAQKREKAIRKQRKRQKKLEQRRRYDDQDDTE